MEFKHDRNSETHSNFYKYLLQNQSAPIEIIARMTSNSVTYYIIQSVSEINMILSNIWLTESECTRPNPYNSNDKRFAEALSLFKAELENSDSEELDKKMPVLDGLIFYIYNEYIKGYLDGDSSYLWTEKVSNHSSPETIQWKSVGKTSTNSNEIAVDCVADYDPYEINFKCSFYLKNIGGNLLIKHPYEEKFLDAYLNWNSSDYIDNENISPLLIWSVKYK